MLAFIKRNIDLEIGLGFFLFSSVGNKNDQKIQFAYKKRDIYIRAI